MKVFISWSGAAEREVAESLSETLAIVSAGRVTAFVSSQSIPKGARGMQAIGASLSASDYGVVILSAANQHAPWITYEAGALARSVQAPVATLLLDLIPSDVTGPLESFQATSFASPEDMRRLFVEIAQRADTAMPEESISILFDAAWPSLQDSWTPPSADDTVQEPRRDDADMLSELVNRMRRMEQKIDHNSRSNGPLRESTTAGKKRRWFDELIDLLGDYGVVISQAGRTNDGDIRVTVDDDVSIIPMAALRALSVVAAQHNRTYVFSGPALPGVTVAPQGIFVTPQG